MTTPPLLVGRSSSHFTRVARIFAAELGVPYTFQPVFDLAATDPAVYAGNPALKIPILVDEAGPLFGTENICRELVRRSGKSGVVERGALRDRLVANAEELVLQAMSTEVLLITAKAMGTPQLVPGKVRQSMENSLRYLDENVDALLRILPEDRTLSFVEVALYCLVRHLPFRGILDVTPWQRLNDFCARFEQRESARSTEYKFDVPG